jgi:hypothetical protein
LSIDIVMVKISMPTKWFKNPVIKKKTYFFANKNSPSPVRFFYSFNQPMKSYI